MPTRRDPPPTDEGWYALHDFRTIDWDAWRDASQRTRQRALVEITGFLDRSLDVEDATEGDSGLYSILGHKADFLMLHLRPTSAHIGALERQFEQTEFASFTERTTSFVSVTEASGYSERAREYFDGELDENSGLANYIQTRLKPRIPDATHVCFYPMSKRRSPEQNWYDLSFDERAEHMEAHGEIGRDYGGRVSQMITGAIALDDWEWGVTLWGDDLVDMKDLLYEMRFDPSTSQFADFGPFYIGRRFPPSDLPALLAGQAVPTDMEQSPQSLIEEQPAGSLSVTTGTASDSDVSRVSADSGAESTSEGSTTHSEKSREGGVTPEESDDSPTPSGDGPNPEEVEPEDMKGHLTRLGLHAGEDYQPDQYGVILYSGADAKDLADEVDELRGHFESYDTHVQTTVRATQGRSAVASLWETERAADIAAGFLTELPEVTRSLRGPLAEGGTTKEQSHTAEQSSEIRDELTDLDVYAGQPHGEDIYALVLYSEAPLETLDEEVTDLRSGFDRYDTHEGTTVYGDPDSERAAVVSLWATEDAANTASDYLTDLPDVIGWADESDGFGTMGMFYTVKPEHREDFVEKFDAVGALLEEMEGHRDSSLLVNTADDNDMFIASLWESKDAAMEFFRSDEFSETVDWGRDILADKPRHVFLA